ncbi:helix-turn-helix domain-containing protein [Hydrogenophaga atypica]|uniref:Helix-turn-helix domain-containing protein n=1 Tax=Hydrogenophaga atypica TaxID=249409 RepID=A0ABW2QQ02_9BURK
MRRNNVPRHASFGSALQRLRAARGLTQEDMLMATSRRHMSRIEQGHQMPSIRVVESLAENLRLHPLSLLAAAYCPDGDLESVQELLQTVQADIAGLINS